MSTALTDRAAARAAWLDERRTGLGGSDMAAVLGLEGTSAVAVWASKVLPRGEDDAPTNRMRWGKRLERAIADEYFEMTGQRGEFLGERLLRRESPGWWIGSPDAVVFGEDGRVAKGLEVKTAGGDQRWKWGESGTDDVPEKHVVQCCHYMPLLAVDVFDLYALLGGNDDRVYTIARDPKLEEVMLEEGDRFWRKYVLTKAPPPMDDSPASRWYLQQRFPQILVDVREATEEEAALVRECMAARAAEKAAKAKADALENSVALAIGDAGGLSVNGARVTWPLVAGAVKWKSVAEELGATADLISKHTGSPYRRLQFPRKGIE